MFKAEIMYESEGKAPNGDAFLTVKKARGYYEYSERPGMDSIAFILYNREKEEFGLIYEAKPPLDERLGEKSMLTTAFGGSIDMSKTYREICQVEVLEEAGYDVPLNKIYSIGTTLVSTQMSQMLEGFLVDVTGLEKTHKTEFEVKMDNVQEEKDPDEFSHNKVVWMSAGEVFDNCDWKSIFILSVADYNGLI